MFKVDDSKLNLVRTNNELIVNGASLQPESQCCEVKLEALQI